jgi:hypothetical protein
MKLSSYKILSILLIFSALAFNVESRDVTVNILTNDIISYDINNLIDNNIVNSKKLSQGVVQKYTSNKPWALVSNVRELESDLIPGGKDTHSISQVLLVSPTLGYIISDEGIGSITVDGLKVTAGENLDTFKQEEVTQIWVSDTQSMVVSIDAEEANLSVFSSTNFDSTTEKKLKWDMTVVIPKVNARAIGWVDTVADPNEQYWLVYQPDTPIATTKVNGFSFVKESDEFSGSFALTAANNFPADVAATLYMTTDSDNTVWVAYNTATPEVGIAKCAFTIANSQFTINEPTDCTSFTVDAQFNGAESVYIGKTGDAYFAWFYYTDATTNNPTVAYCDINTAETKLENCVASTQLVNTYGAVFDKLTYSDATGLNVLFSVLDDGATIRRTTSLMYNIAKNGNAITFDVVEDRAAGVIVGFKENAWVFREETYSTYGPQTDEQKNPWHVTIYANQVGAASDTVAITLNEGEATVVSNINLNISDDSTGSYSQLVTSRNQREMLFQLLEVTSLVTL